MFYITESLTTMFTKTIDMPKWALFLAAMFLGQNQLLQASQFYAYKESPKETAYNMTCMSCTPCKDDAYTIAFTKHWKIGYVNNQSYLGRVVLTSHRHFGSYEEMTDEEALEYRQIFKQLFPALQKTFNVTHFNVVYLMNMAYNRKNPEPPFKEGKPNPHFHWNIVPRHDGARKFAGRCFEDPTFGRMFNFRRKKILREKFPQQAIEAIRKNLEIIYL